MATNFTNELKQDVSYLKPSFTDDIINEIRKDILDLKQELREHAAQTQQMKILILEVLREIRTIKGIFKE